MYSYGNAPVGNFFNFREMGGLNINKVQDIPYDFYALVPMHLQPLYQEMRRERQWEGGYVSGVHDKLLSSRIVPAITNVITDKILGSGYKYDGDDLRVQVLDTWDRKVHFKDAIELLAHNATILGFSFLKVDWIGGVPHPTVVPADQIFYIMRNRQIIDAKTVVSFSISNDKLSYNKYLIEHRYFDKDGNPMIRHFFTSTSSQFSESASAVKNAEIERGLTINPSLLADFGISVKVGDNFIAELEKLGIYINPKKIPSKNGLAIKMVKATVQNPTYIKSGLGQGIMAQMGEDNLIKYEIANSLHSHELNISPQIVLVPQGFDNGRINDPFANITGGLNNFNSIRPVNKTYYVRIPYGDSDNGAEPKTIEFTIRSNEILAMKNSALRDLLLNIGLTPKDFGLESEKAVYTSTSELKFGNISSNMISRRRRLMEEAIEMMVDEVLYSLGIENNGVKVLWTDSVVSDFEKQINSYSIAVKNFLMSPEEAVRRLYPNKTNAEINKLLMEIDKNRQAIVNTFYGGNNENNSKKEKGDLNTSETVEE
jgi:hypothetical protein